MQDIYVVIEHLRGQVDDISYIMLAAAHSLAEHTGDKVIGLLLGHHVQALANNLAVDQVLYVEHPSLRDFTSDAYLKVLADLIHQNAPRVVFFGNTSIGADVASALSARLDLPILNLCQSIGPQGHLICKICGGKIMTESNLPDTTTIITMIPGGYKPELGQRETAPPITPVDVLDLAGLRVTLKKYIEPDTSGVDITKEPILVSVGRGIQNADNIELAEALAESLGGVVCGSRPVIDQGWLPTSLMVGKSGKKVKPKLYLAIGISGAPEHAEGMMDSETIIAINMDPTAPIFSFANYGAKVDLFDLIEVLTGKVQETKG